MQVESNGRGTVETEVVAKAKRRRFDAEYKKRILREADACTKPGEVGALLRREGLYSSHLASGRAERDRREMDALSPKKRGPKPKEKNPLDGRVRELEAPTGARAQTRRAGRGAGRAAKKVSELLGIAQPTSEDIERDS